MTRAGERAKAVVGIVWAAITSAAGWTGRILLAAGRLFVRAIKFPLPQIVFVLLANRRIHRSLKDQVDSADAMVEQADAVELDAAIALWQFETDRFNGLASKGAAVLAADAIVATGLSTQTASKGLAACLCVAALVYVASATVAVCVVQRPTARYVAQPRDVLEGTSANAMVAGVISNEREGIKLQNLVYVGVRDTAISLGLLLAALAYKFVS